MNIRSGNATNNRIGTRAFTFAEVLAAMVFLGILIPVIVESLNLSTRAAAYADHKAMAAQLAENKLNENILYRSTGMANRDNSGDFGPDYPGYRYEITETAWSSDSLTELTVNVFFTVQGKEDSVALTTLFDDNSTGTTTTSSSSTGTMGSSTTR